MKEGEADLAVVDGREKWVYGGEVSPGPWDNGSIRNAFAEWI